MKKILLASATGLWLALGTTSYAQTTDATPKAAPAPVVALPDLNKKVAPLTVDQMPLREVAAKLSAQAGVRIVVDSVSGATPISLDGKSETVAEVMKQISTQLGKGGVVRYVALAVQEPMPASDMITQAIAAQDALKPLRIAGAEADPNAPRKPKRPVASPEQGVVAPATTTEPTIEIAGRSVTFANAAPLVGSLGLTPVYVVMNPLGDNPVAKSGRLQAEGLELWLAMTPDQRKQAADSQLNNLLSMDPSTRRALFGQMMEQGQAMTQKIMALPPEQRAQFFRDVTGGKFDGTGLPPGGKPGN